MDITKWSTGTEAKSGEQFNEYYVENCISMDCYYIHVNEHSLPDLWLTLD